jgi:L-asparaginase
MPSAATKLLIIGTGGTIAGRASNSIDHVGYRAGEVGIEELVAGVPPLRNFPLLFEQLAQLDSKDMDFDTWVRLAVRVQAAMDDPEVGGVVVTHGTDTLEETACLLHHVLRGGKPVVLTAAMRPASSLSPDGPQNLMDAITLASAPDVCGVLVAFAGRVHRADRVRKVHSYQVDAFESPDGAVALLEDGRLRVLQPWCMPLGFGVDRLPTPAEAWPRVTVIWNAAGEDGAQVPLLEALAMQEQRSLGIVAAGTGNGSLSAALETALLAAQARGVAVLRATRCANGPVIGGGGLPNAGAMSLPQARVALLLSLIEGKQAVVEGKRG